MRGGLWDGRLETFHLRAGGHLGLVSSDLSSAVWRSILGGADVSLGGICQCLQRSDETETGLHLNWTSKCCMSALPEQLPGEILLVGKNGAVDTWQAKWCGIPPANSHRDGTVSDAFTREGNSPALPSFRAVQNGRTDGIVQPACWNGTSDAGNLSRAILANEQAVTGAGSRGAVAVNVLLVSGTRVPRTVLYVKTLPAENVIVTRMGRYVLLFGQAVSLVDWTGRRIIGFEDDGCQHQGCSHRAGMAGDQTNSGNPCAIVDEKPVELKLYERQSRITPPIFVPLLSCGPAFSFESTFSTTVPAPYSQVRHDIVNGSSASQGHKRRFYIADEKLVLLRSSIDQARIRI